MGSLWIEPKVTLKHRLVRVQRGPNSELQIPEIPWVCGMFMMVFEPIPKIGTHQIMTRKCRGVVMKARSWASSPYILLRFCYLQCSSICDVICIYIYIESRVIYSAYREMSPSLRGPFYHHHHHHYYHTLEF